MCVAGQRYRRDTSEEYAKALHISNVCNGMKMCSKRLTFICNALQ